MVPLKKSKAQRQAQELELRLMAFGITINPFDAQDVGIWGEGAANHVWGILSTPGGVTLEGSTCEPHYGRECNLTDLNPGSPGGVPFHQHPPCSLPQCRKNGGGREERERDRHHGATDCQPVKRRRLSQGTAWRAKAPQEPEHSFGVSGLKRGGESRSEGGGGARRTRGRRAV